MKIRNTIFGLVLFVLMGCAQDRAYDQEQGYDTGIFCDANNECTEGQCLIFHEGTQATCYIGDPCSECPSNKCMIIKTLPGSVECENSK